MKLSSDKHTKKKDVAFTFDITQRDIVKVSNATTTREKSVKTQAGTTLSIVSLDGERETPPTIKISKETIERIISTPDPEITPSPDTPAEEEITYVRQTREILSTESLESKTLKDYIISLNNEEFDSYEFDIVLKRVMNYVIPEETTKTISSEKFPTFIFGYEETDSTTKLNNSLRDYFLRPKFNYGIGAHQHGFVTLREAVETYQHILNQGSFISSFNTEIFNDINKILFSAQSSFGGLSENRVPLTYSLMYRGDGDFVFGDYRDLILLKSLNHNFQQLSLYEKANYIALIAKGVLHSIHTEHRENIEKLKKQFLEDLSASGLSLVDITQFDFSAVNWSELFDDPLGTLYSLSDATKDSIAAYFTDIKDAFSELFTTTGTLLESLTFDISKYPDDYLIFEEICKWLNLASNTTFADYEDSRLLYFTKALGAFLNSPGQGEELFDFSRLALVSRNFELDAENTATNYLTLIHTLNTDNEVKQYADYFTGAIYGLEKSRIN